MLLTILEHFSTCVFGLNFCWNILVWECSLIKVKVTLGIFYGNNIHISIGKENNTKMFSRGWGFSSTYFFLRFRVFLPVVLQIRIFILLCKPSTVNEQSAKVQFHSIMHNGIFFHLPIEYILLKILQTLSFYNWGLLQA